MNKPASVVWELIGLIVTILGVIGMAQSARDFMYRRQPRTDLRFEQDFLAMIQTESDREFFEQLVAPDLDLIFGANKTPEKALDELTQILARYPAYSKGYLVRGQTYLSKGQILAGIEDMQVVIEQSNDRTLRRGARTEIILARLAQVLTPIPFLGLAGIGLLIVADFVGINVFTSLRSIKAFIVAFVITALSLLFLVLH
jgi:hypothetical protein